MRQAVAVGLVTVVVAAVVMLARSATPRVRLPEPATAPAPAAPGLPVEATDLAVKTIEGRAVAVRLQATGGDGKATFQTLARPAHGTLSGTGAEQLYRPAAGYVGEDSFTYRTRSGDWESRTATVRITVAPRLRTVWAFGKGVGEAPGDCRFAPVQVKALTKARAIEAGNPSWAVVVGGRLKHWDWPAGEKERRGEALSKLRQLRDVAAISASGGWLLGVKTDGSVWAWGRNAKGGLETGKLGGSNDEPLRIPAVAKARQVASGPEHALVLSDDGTVWAWGHGHNGELGLGSLNDQPMPAPVPGIDGAVFIAAGDYMSYAVKGDGSLWAWGANYAGQLGLGSSERQVKTPALMTSLTGVVAAASSTERRATPVQVKGLEDVIAVAAGQEHCLALKKDGTVWAWGGNKCGQIGQPPAVEKQLTPAQVSGLSGVAAIGARGFQSLALVIGEEADETPPEAPAEQPRKAEEEAVR
ncbi:MAG: Ig-like domain-containing protein [Planctomycetota bacterium]|nr:Ig-like domain-containing protein [Planctomycetota bacterium]